mmetsp:Transcript_31683/g.71656  ORF Transcript_31683/g.71656 Transcript_31683/m.71656 type:complete len:305 (+) Transcript_31683:477-1391(+)
MAGSADDTTSKPESSLALLPADEPIPALISARASECFFLSASDMFLSFSSSMSSWSSTTGATLKSPSAPISLSRRAFRRSIRSMLLRRFSCRRCLSVLGIDAMMSSASTGPSSSSDSPDLLFPRCCFFFFLGRESSPSDSMSWTPSCGAPSSSDASSSAAPFLSAAKLAARAVVSMFSKRGLLNHRLVLTDAGSSLSLSMSGFDDSVASASSMASSSSASSCAFFAAAAAFCFFFLAASLSLPSLTTSPSASLSYSSLLPSLSSLPSALPPRSSAYFLASSLIASPPAPTISASSLASSMAFCL